MRDDGRLADEIRPVTITTGYQDYPDGSALIECGNTKVICSAYVENRVPSFLEGKGKGWVTAEYAMLPGAGVTRMRRERTPKGRSMEIQRLIGRSLRSVTDLAKLGENTITIDCDVLQADGGTRTASITGAFVALALAAGRLKKMGVIGSLPFHDTLSAISVGVIEGNLLLDLPYSEDSRADVDMNIVMTGEGALVEVQGTAEGATFTRDEMNQMLDLAEKGCGELRAKQQTALGELFDEIIARNA